MKLILASQGFTTPEIANAAAQLVGKPLDQINVAIINEAYIGIAPSQDMRWLIRELGLISQNVGGTISLVSLRAYDDIDEVRKRLEFTDLIYLVGGSGASAALPSLFQKTGFDKLLKDLAGTKVIMGTSAGAAVLGQQIQNPEYWDDQYGDGKKYTAIPTLALADFQIIPHFGRGDRPRRKAEIITPLLKNEEFPVFGIADEQAIISDDSQVEFVGGEPLYFGAKYQA
ncbi:peptidase E [Candidatus Saccharibacteria bacterium]|nr:peptidase E [Candidatus Saccharibacteria bacterium]